MRMIKVRAATSTQIKNARSFLCTSYVGRRRAEDASAKLQQALLLDPNLPIAHASLGMVRMAQKNFVEANRLLPELPDVQLMQFYHRLPMNLTYWKGYPTKDDPYVNPAFFHSTYGYSRLCNTKQWSSKQDKSLGFGWGFCKN